MKVTRTVKIPIHHETTKKKISHQDNLTARLTYAVREWYKIIDENELENKSDCSPYESEVQEKTKLSAGFVQQARDKALWTREQDKESHKEWERKLEKAKEGTKWYKKLKEREPSKPFTSKRSKQKKIPVRFDYRTGSLEEADLALTDSVIRISTLKKGERIVILLNPGEYHKKKLKKADKICSFELVHHPERGCKYMVHVTYEYDIKTRSVDWIRGVDLGVLRGLASVKLPWTRKNFSIRKTDKLAEIKELNDRIAHSRRLEKYEALKKLRKRRSNLTKDYDRKLAKEFAEHTDGEIVIVGDPQEIRYRKFKGNGDKIGRKVLQNWTFGRLGYQIVEKCRERGTISIRFNEWNTSNRSYCCGEKVKSTGRRVECTNCGQNYDREFNSCVRILQTQQEFSRKILRSSEFFQNSERKASSYLENKSSEALERSQKLAGATDELARTMDDSGLEPWMSMEAHTLGCG